MNKKTTNVFNRKTLIIFAKIIACVLITALTVFLFFENAMRSKKDDEAFDSLNSFNESNVIEHSLSDGITQSFLAQGNRLTQVKLYISRIDPDAEKLSISLSDNKGNVLKETVVPAVDLVLGWNSIELPIDKLSLNSIYNLGFSTSSTSSIFVLTDENTEKDSNLKDCYFKGTVIDRDLVVGINIVNENTAPESIEYLITNSVFFLCLTAIALFVIVKFEDCLSYFKHGCSVLNWIYAIIFSVLYTTQYNPLNPTRTFVLEFTRSIGHGIMYDYDVSRVIKNFFIWFSLFAVCLIVFLLFVNYARTTFNSLGQNKAWKYTDNIAILALVNTAICAFSFFYNESLSYEIFSYSTTLVNLFLLSGLAYIVFRLDERITLTNYQILFLIGFATAYPIAALCGLEWSNGALLACIQAVLFTVIIVVLKFAKPIKISYRNKKTLLISIATVSSTLPFLLSFYIELVNILNQHNVFIANPRKWFGIGMLIPIFVCVIIAILIHKKKISVSNPKAFIYPALIFGVTALSVQVPLTAVYATDLFETANYSVLISDFLFFGDIPIVQHYGGHMMSGVWEGIFYGLVNGDFSGAGFNPYSRCLLPFVVLLFYWFVKTVWDEDAAFSTTLFFPFLSSWEYFGHGILIAAAMLAFVRKNTYLKAVVLWLACVWVALYRLDLGANFIIPCIIALAYYTVSKKNFKATKQLGITLAGYAIVFGTLWCSLCLVKDVNPITRLFEFLSISASNQNWAYLGIGNNSLMVYSWVYLVLPFAVITAIAYTLLSKNFKKELSIEKILLIIFMGASFLLHLLTRSLVRHSIAEMSVPICVFSGYVFIAMFAAFKSKKQIFIPIFAFLITFGNLFITTGNPATKTIADTASTKMSEYSFVDSWNSEDDMWGEIAKNKQVVNRVQKDPNMISQLRPLEDALDKLLNEDETYVDFSNITVTYTYFEKHNPVYVSQSPYQLSGEYTQERFVEQIKENIQKNPVCLLPAQSYISNFSFDGIFNNYRYYKVAEFIYQNYVPLCSIDNTAIWCIPERYDDMKLKLSGKYEIFEFSNSNKPYNTNDCIVENTPYGLKLTGNGIDPYFDNFSDFADFAPFIGKDATIKIQYSASANCYFQLFYTTEQNENFSEQKSIFVSLSDNGIATFTIPVTQYTKLRLDISGDGNVIIKSSLVQEFNITFCDYGDEPSYFHYYNLNLLPQIWAEKDKNESSKNAVLSPMIQENGVWTMNPISPTDKTNGNYLLLRLYYKGTDVKGLTSNDDESTTTAIHIGKKSDNGFVELYNYTITVKEGVHDYLIRLSCDSFWFSEEINAVVVDSTESLKVNELLLLMGD